LKKTIKISEIVEELWRYGKCKIKEMPLDLNKTIKVPPKDVSEIIKVLKDLGDSSKLRILLLLRNGPLPVCIISYVLKLDQTLVSHHLNKLTRAELVESTRRGKFKLYNLTDRSRRLLDMLLSLTHQHRKPETEDASTFDQTVGI
jgi:DNA-binding transcriptional ArsR family regulator